MIDAYTAWHNSSSWARHGRQFFEALGRYDQVRVWAFDSDPLGNSRFVIGTERLYRHEKSACHAIIGICPLGRLNEITGDKKIAFIAFESTYLKSEIIATLDGFDRVWVPSCWGKSILISNGVREHRIDVVPEGVDVDHFSPRKQPNKWLSMALHQMQRPRFRFLSVGKWEARKNIDGLVAAFSRAFRPTEPVELVLHCSNQFTPFNYEARVRLLTNGSHPPIMISKPCSWDSMSDLYASSDAFILPSRAEGWGLPIIEAMASGLPVIITRYSAPLEYTSSESAYYIDVEDLIPIRDPVFYAEDMGGEWAEPSVSHMVNILRHVYEHRDEAKHKGSIARQLVIGGWTWDHAAAKAMAVLHKLRVI